LKVVVFQRKKRKKKEKKKKKKDGNWVGIPTLVSDLALRSLELAKEAKQESRY